MNSSKRPGESLYTEEELNGTTAVKKPREDEVAKKEEAKNGNLVSEAAKTTHTGLADVLHAYGARRGEREDMQDAHLALSRFELANLTSLKRSSLFAIFDGHAGARAAEFCEKRVAATLRQKLSSYSELAVMEKGLKKAFTESFKTIDEAFLNAARQTKPVWKDGTTITTMLVLNNVLYVANLGDSKAVVARTRPDGTLSAICLTVDHNPTVFEERMRIQKTGATVKDGRVNGVIEVSRSIGDGPFKSLGVTCLPDMKKLTMTENDRFAIIACDGLWKTFSNEEAVQYASAQFEAVAKEELPRQLGETQEHAKWRTVAERLAAEAVRRKCGDNVSVLLVKLSIV